MFNDGYDLFCESVISEGSRKTKGTDLDLGVYCGCLDYVAMERAKNEPRGLVAHNVQAA